MAVFQKCAPAYGRYRRSKICWFQSACRNGSECPYIHTDSGHRGIDDCGNHTLVDIISRIENLERRNSQDAQLEHDDLACNAETVSLDGISRGVPPKRTRRVRPRKRRRNSSNSEQSAERKDFLFVESPNQNIQFQKYIARINELENLVSTLNQERKQCSDVEENLKEQQTKFELLQSEHKRALGKLKKVVEEKKVQRGNIEKLQTALKESTKREQSVGGELANLRSELESQNIQMERLENVLEKNNELQSEISAERQQCVHLRAQLDAKSANLEESSVEVTALESQLANERTSLVERDKKVNIPQTKYGRKFQEIAAMVAQGITPDDVKQINDMPPDPHAPPTESVLSQPRKPFESGDAKRGLSWFEKYEAQQETH